METIFYLRRYGLKTSIEYGICVNGCMSRRAHDSAIYKQYQLLILLDFHHPPHLSFFLLETNTQGLAI